MTTLLKAMTTSISEVLETMFFLPPAFGEDVTPQNNKTLDHSNLWACRLDFQGPQSGTFVAALPDTALRQMTMNFMGTEADALDEPELSGTLKELLNMIAGNTCSLLDASAEFHLTIPDTIEPAQAARWLRDTDKLQAFSPVETSAGPLAIGIVAI